MIATSAPATSPMDYSGFYLKRWLQDQYGSTEDWREVPDNIELAPGIVIEVPKPKLYGAGGEVLGGSGIEED